MACRYCIQIAFHSVLRWVLYILIKLFSFKYILICEKAWVKCASRCVSLFFRCFIIIVLAVDLVNRIILYFADSTTKLQFKMCNGRGDAISINIAFEKMHCIREYNEDLIVIWDSLVSIAAISSSIFIFYTSSNKFDDFGMTTWKNYKENWCFHWCFFHCKLWKNCEKKWCLHCQKCIKSENAQAKKNISRVKKCGEEFVSVLFVFFAILMAIFWIYANISYAISFVNYENWMVNKTEIVQNDAKIYYPIFLIWYVVFTSLSSFHWHASIIVAIIIIKYYCTYVKKDIRRALKDSKEYIRKQITKLSIECKEIPNNENKNEEFQMGRENYGTINNSEPEILEVMDDQDKNRKEDGNPPIIAYYEKLNEVKQLKENLGVLPTILVGIILFAIAILIIEYFSTADVKYGLYYFLIEKKEYFEISRFSIMYILVFGSISLMLRNMSGINAVLETFGDELTHELYLTKQENQNQYKTENSTKDHPIRDTEASNILTSLLPMNSNPSEVKQNGYISIEGENKKLRKFIKKMTYEITSINSSKGRFEIAYFGAVGQDLINFVTSLGTAVVVSFIIQLVMMNKITESTADSP